MKFRFISSQYSPHGWGSSSLELKSSNSSLNFKIRGCLLLSMKSQTFLLNSTWLNLSTRNFFSSAKSLMISSLFNWWRMEYVRELWLHLMSFSTFTFSFRLLEASSNSYANFLSVLQSPCVIAKAYSFVFLAILSSAFSFFLLLPIFWSELFRLTICFFWKIISKWYWKKNKTPFIIYNDFIILICYYARLHNVVQHIPYHFF